MDFFCLQPWREAGDVLFDWCVSPVSNLRAVVCDHACLLSCSSVYSCCSVSFLLMAQSPELFSALSSRTGEFFSFDMWRIFLIWYVTNNQVFTLTSILKDLFILILPFAISTSRSTCIHSVWWCSSIEKQHVLASTHFSVKKYWSGWITFSVNSWICICVAAVTFQLQQDNEYYTSETHLKSMSKMSVPFLRNGS